MQPRREWSTRPPYQTRVHSTPPAYPPQVWRVRACPASRSARRVRHRRELSGRCLFRRPAPVTEAALGRIGFPLRSAPHVSDGTHCAPPRLQSGRPRPGGSEPAPVGCLPPAHESRDRNSLSDCLLLPPPPIYSPHPNPV